MRKWLTRGRRTAVNLLLTGAVLFLIWAMAGYPLGSPLREHRRLERSYLLEESHVVASFPGREGDNDITWVISVAEEYVAVGCRQEDRRLYICPTPSQEPVVVPLRGISGAGDSTVRWLLATHLPENVARGELTLYVTGDFEESYQMEGERLPSGDMLFPMEWQRLGEEDDPEWAEEREMAADLFRDPSQREGRWSFSVHGVFWDEQGREACEATALEERWREILAN